MNRLQKVRSELAQCNEDWALRAVKLQLLYPSIFEEMTRIPSWRTQLSMMQVWRSVLSKIDFGKLTTYRMSLLQKACRALKKEMRDVEKRNQTQDTREAAGVGHQSLQGAAAS